MGGENCTFIDPFGCKQSEVFIKFWSDKMKDITYLKKCLIENFPIFLSVFSQDKFAKVWIVNETINIYFICHVNHFLFTRIQTQRLHGIQGILGKNSFKSIQSRTKSFNNTSLLISKLQIYFQVRSKTLKDQLRTFLSSILDFPFADCRRPIT